MQKLKEAIGCLALAIPALFFGANQMVSWTVYPPDNAIVFACYSTKLIYSPVVLMHDEKDYYVQDPATFEIVHFKTNKVVQIQPNEDQLLAFGNFGHFFREEKFRLAPDHRDFLSAGMTPMSSLLVYSGARRLPWTEAGEWREILH
jgi:hypothetical protein